MSFLITFCYPVFFLISIVLPRNKKLWVFGHFSSFSDNTKYFFEYALKESNFHCYWLANSQEEAKEVSRITDCVVIKKSFRGYWLSSRAYVTFICTGFGDVNRLLALNSNVINFWHGTPIKKVFQAALLNKNDNLKNDIIFCVKKIFLDFIVKCTNFFYLSNTKEAELLLYSSNIEPRKIRIFGAPRFDRIKANGKNDKRLSTWDRVILYAPTWRSNGDWGGIQYTPRDITGLNIFLEQTNTLLLVKLHPLTNIGEIKSMGLNSTKYIKFADEMGFYDINYLYSQVDILLTDISSAIFDFMLLNKKVILFMPDIENYLSKDRNIYNYFKIELSKFAIKTLNDLLFQLKNIEKHDSSMLISEIASEMRTYHSPCASILADITSTFYKK